MKIRSEGWGYLEMKGGVWNEFFRINVKINVGEKKAGSLPLWIWEKRTVEREGRVRSREV